jgi:hypothetical protein
LARRRGSGIESSAVESVYARMDSRGGGLGALGEGLVEAGFDLVIDALRNVLRP